MIKIDALDTNTSFFYLQLSLLVFRKSPLRTWLARGRNGARIVPSTMQIHPCMITDKCYYKGEDIEGRRFILLGLKCKTPHAFSHFAVRHENV